MVAKPESPDFDSMSQDELRAFLAQLERERGEMPPQPADTGAKNGDLSDQLDDTQRSLPAQSPDVADGDEDDNAPADLLPDAADFAPPPDALGWLREIAAADIPEELPDITDYQAPEVSLSLDDILRASPEPEDDALVWLDKLAIEFNSPPRDTRQEIALPADFGDDFREDFEDDERLNDQEDESLYSPRGTVSGALAQPGWDDRQAADQPRQADRLANAFALPGDATDLEAWYAERLAALEGRGTSPPAASPQPTSEPASETSPEPQAAAKLPPPGLAAAINSARAKVAAEALDEALIVYESLLGTPAGLDWVEMDMRALLDQPTHEDDPLLHRMLGDALMRSGQLEAALASYRQALALV